MIFKETDARLLSPLSQKPCTGLDIFILESLDIHYDKTKIQLNSIPYINKPLFQESYRCLEKRGAKYRHAFEAQRNNWDALTSYFDFPQEIRKIIYTANTIENPNRSIRKYTKTKVQFPDDQAAQKAVYMAIMNIKKKYAHPKLGVHTPPSPNYL